MSQDVTGLISWLRSWFDDIYAPKGQSGDLDFDDIYPVGSIYLSLSSTFDPNVYFDGTWERISNAFLYASENGQGIGTTGGEETHTLTSDEMPSHTHTQNSHNHTQNAHNHSASSNSFVQSNVDLAINGTARSLPSSGGNAHYVYVHHDKYSSSETISVSSTTANRTATNQSTTATNQNTGGGQAHNNMPPYLTVNMWKRTA